MARTVSSTTARAATCRGWSLRLGRAAASADSSVQARQRALRREPHQPGPRARRRRRGCSARHGACSISLVLGGRLLRRAASRSYEPITTTVSRFALGLRRRHRHLRGCGAHAGAAAIAGARDDQTTKLLLLSRGLDWPRAANASRVPTRRREIDGVLRRTRRRSGPERLRLHARDHVRERRFLRKRRCRCARRVRVARARRNGRATRSYGRTSNARTSTRARALFRSRDDDDHRDAAGDLSTRGRGPVLLPVRTRRAGHRLRTLWMDPVARGVLGSAATVATESDAARDAEAGEILHRDARRHGEPRRRSANPFRAQIPRRRRRRHRCP